MGDSGKLDLDSEYYKRFDEALAGRYGGKTFKDGFTEIEKRFAKLRREDSQRLQVEDVLELFSHNLPYYEDWTKPDKEELEFAMQGRDGTTVPELIHRLKSAPEKHEIELITQIRHGFRELSLMALVLHHVFPRRYAMCSHHLASLLYIANAETIPKFYVEYCRELRLWGEKASSRRLSAADTEFALWTWYRFSNYGRDEDKRKHRNRLFRDPWVAERRAFRVAESLKGRSRIDLAMSYVSIDANVAAAIAYIELERTIRQILAKDPTRETKANDFRELVEKLPMSALPTSSRDLVDLWKGNGKGRNAVIHGTATLNPAAAAEIIRGVSDFIDHQKI
jgi:hypothetical protein